MDQRGCKYIDADEAFNRVVRAAEERQGAYLFYFPSNQAYQVVRGAPLTAIDPGTKERVELQNTKERECLKKKLDRDEHYLVGYYRCGEDGRPFDKAMLREDIEHAPEVIIEKDDFDFSGWIVY